MKVVLFLALNMLHLPLEVPLNFLILSEFNHSLLFNIHLMPPCIVINYLTPESVLLFILKSAKGAKLANILLSRR